MPNPSTPELGEGQLKRRARLGMITLAVRSVLQNLVILVSNIYLARLLSPGDYGVFGILQFAMSLLKLVGETGLGAALLQKQDTPEDVELSTVWWVQLGLGLLLVGASFAVVPLLPLIWPTLPSGSQWLLPALSLSLLFTMLRAVPFLILERQVSFGWVGMLEFLGTLTFYGTALVLAFRGAGALALVWASVGQAALIAIAANVFQPWRPRFMFSWQKVRELLRFGAAFQGNHVIGFLNSAVTPLLAGAKLGKEALGMIQFAQNTAWFPTLPVGIVRRVYFPYLSRLQHQEEAFALEFETAVALCALPTFFFFGLFCGGAPALVEIIYGSKWSSTVPAVYLYSFGFCFTFYTWIGSAAIEALGKTGQLFRIQMISMLSNWAATVVAVWWLPTVTAFAAGFCVHLIVTPFALHYTLTRLAPRIRPWPRVMPPLVASVVCGGVGRLLLPWVTGPGTLIAWSLVSTAAFLTVELLLDAKVRGLARHQLNKLLKRAGTVPPPSL